MQENRPDPELLLSRLKKEEEKVKKGKLKIFLGAVAGVGKTYAMLEAAQKLKEEGVDVLGGYVETHGRQETEALLEGLETLPLHYYQYKGTELKEFDIDAALARKPQLILLDELAHTNAPGSRHAKRFQDVYELLEAGIDVYTTLNVQHIESLHDVVAQITGVSVRERVPDSLLEDAQDIALVDLPPDELLVRLKEGKVYLAHQAKAAIRNFFRKGNLIALRELVLRFLAERVVADMDAYRQLHHIKYPWPASEKILVCVSSSPLAVRLVRAGKRMAEALRAPWLVLYVEGQRQMPLSEKDKDRVVQTLRLAEQLGAETIELSASHVSEEIIKCANQYNVSKVIIGKPARPRWRELLFGSVVDEIIRLSGPIDVYVISGENGDALPSTARPIQTSSQASAYVTVFSIVCLLTVLAKLILPYLELTNIVMFYLLAVVFIASRFGKGPSIFASILSVACFDFFCVPPYLTFAVSDTQYLITFAVMLVVALVISTLTVTKKQQADAARLREIRTYALYAMSRDLSSILDKESIAAIGLRHIAEVFDCKAAVFLACENGKLKLTAKGAADYSLSPAAEGVAAWVFQNKQAAGLGTDTLPGTAELYLPLLGAQANLGVLVIEPKEKGSLLSPEQLRLLETFANQMATACERTLLAAESEHARVLVKTEQLRSSLLSSVSHDLRTPLATIAGAASSILEGTQLMTMERCKQLVREIYNEAMRLNRLVSNLLDMTKLQSGSMGVAEEDCPVEEIVGSAVTYFEERFNSHKIKTKIPANLPFVSVDSTLIQQALVNLLENAVKYSPENTEIEISAEANSDKSFVTISVNDRGPGVKEENREKVFEKFFREQGGQVSGAGLGLAICSGIIEAHQGKIWVEDRAGGGASFRFTLPASELISSIELEDTQLNSRESENV